MSFPDPVCTIDLVTMIEAEGGLSPQVREVLGAYLGASLLADGFQTELWREARLTLAQLAVLRSLRDGGPGPPGTSPRPQDCPPPRRPGSLTVWRTGAWSAVIAGTTTAAASRSTSPRGGASSSVRSACSVTARCGGRSRP